MTAFLNNPLQVADVSLFADEIDGIGSTDMTVGREKFLRLINMLGVANVDESTVFTVKKLSGGITNALCIVILHLAGGDLPVVLRLFGIGTEQFIDRKVENIVFSKLSQSGDGPIFYGLFRTGRLEGFLPGMQCCEAEEMALRSVYIPVARTVAQLHHLSIKEVDMMQSDWLWNIIELFLKLGMAQDFSRRSEAQQEQLANLQLNKIRDEVTWYRGYIESLHEAIIADLVPTAQQGYFFGQRLALQRVLCHNDLLCGNIMRTSGVDVSDSNEVAIKLIDYEYAGYNYRAYDLANHFCGMYMLLAFFTYIFIVFFLQCLKIMQNLVDSALTCPRISPGQRCVEISFAIISRKYSS